MFEREVWEPLKDRF